MKKHRSVTNMFSQSNRLHDKCTDMYCPVPLSEEDPPDVRDIMEGIIVVNTWDKINASGLGYISSLLEEEI